MAEGFAAPPINPLISITPLSTSAANRDATAVPAQLANTLPGTLVEGFVVNRDGQGNPILRTVLGDILVKSDVFIKTGSEVVFRVDTTQVGHARILTIDGLPPQDYSAMHTRGLSGDMVSQTQMSTTARAAPMPLTALLVNTTPLASAAIASNPLLASVAAGSVPVPAGLLKLQQGAQLQVKLLQVSLPAIGELGHNAPAFVPTPSSQPPRQDTPLQQSQQMASAHVARTAESLTSLVQAGAPVDSLPNIMNQAATMAAIKAQATEAKLPLPDGSLKQQQSAQPAQTAVKPQGGVPAYILGHEKDGAAILQTPVGTLKIYLPTPLPVGTGLRLQLEPVPIPAPGQLTMSQAPNTVTTLAQGWPALEETLALFSGTHEAARPMMQAIPEVGPKLTSGLLFFITALKTGDLRQWLGARAVAALEARSPSLASRLKQDMTQLQTLLVDSPLQQWSSAMVPMLYQGQLEHARLFFRDDGEENSKQGKKDSDQRFIVEVDLSHLGEVQFDGFVRQKNSAKQFDLIVRSSSYLPADVQSQIRTTFDNAMQTSGIKGYLAFQEGSQHFVRPMAETKDNGPSGPQPILA